MANPRYIRILSISDDFMVRSTRELVLRKDGYEIVSIGSDELLSVPEIRSFDVAVICHSVPATRTMELLDRLRRYKPGIRVLRVNPRYPRIDREFDVDSEVRSGPGALLKAVKELLDRNAGPGALRGVPSNGHDEYCGPFPTVPWSFRTLHRM